MGNDKYLYSSIKNRPRLPNSFEKLVASFLYIMPLLDSIPQVLSLFEWWKSIGWFWYQLEPIFLFLNVGTIIPLIAFLAIFFVIVNNKDFHHVVRFHALQSQLISIIIYTIVVSEKYLFPNFRWSIFMELFHRFLGATIITTLIYCIWHAIQGFYANLPYISDNIYLQIDFMAS